MNDVQASALFAGPEHRATLSRWWAPGPRALVCMANPSTADATTNDPTIHNLIRLIQALGYPGFTVVNVETKIASWPKDLRTWLDTVDHAERKEWRDRNEADIRALSEGAAVRIAAWGNEPRQDWHLARIVRALTLDGRHPLMAFALTKNGHPRHPLARGTQRLVVGAPLIVWQGARAAEAAA